MTTSRSAKHTHNHSHDHNQRSDGSHGSEHNHSQGPSHDPRKGSGQSREQESGADHRSSQYGAQHHGTEHRSNQHHSTEHDRTERHSHNHVHSHGPNPHGGHNHHHGHGHHHGHSHAPAVTAQNARRIAVVFLLTAGYAVVQAVGGWLSGSLALIADAGHMVSDAAALLLALLAYRIAARAPDARRTYGFHRVRVLAALANGASLLLLVAWIVWEAIGRLRVPSEVLTGPMLLVACIGLLVNVAGAAILWRGDRDDGNLRGALLHVIGDLLGSIGAIAAAIGIMFTGWNILDPILSILVAALVVRSAWGLVADSINILLQAVPRGLDARALEDDIAGLPGVADAGHFHAWTLTDDSIVATVHITPAAGADPLDLPSIVAAHLHDRYAIDHVTVQVDRPGELQKVH